MGCWQHFVERPCQELYHQPCTQHWHDWVDMVDFDTCNGNIIDNWVKPGYARYGASEAWDIGVDDRDYCSGSYRGWSLGTHDFKEGSSQWRPYLSTDEGL